MSEEEKNLVRQQYSSCGPEGLAEEGKHLTVQQKRNNETHRKAMHPYLAISSGCGEDRLSDRHYTVGFFHNQEHPVGPMHWFVHLARRHFFTIATYGLITDASTFVFNFDFTRLLEYRKMTEKKNVGWAGQTFATVPWI
jgi:hypothetical protein